MPNLNTFDGRDVVTTSVQITNAGDGLSTALTVEPVEFHHGDIVCVVLRCEVTKVGFVPVKDTDVLNRVHTLRTGDATIVEESLVKKVLDEQRRKIEAARGVQRLPGVEGDADLDTPSNER